MNEVSVISGGKNLRISVLLDHYSAMLTDKQRDVIELYYNEDLSLAEIAENRNISRQGVRDSIKRGEQTLLELEKALGIAEKSEKILAAADRMERGADSMTADMIRAAAKEIKDIL